MMNDIEGFPSRRVFLMGLGAVTAATALASPAALAFSPEASLEDVAEFARLDSKLSERAIADIMFSTMSDGLSKSYISDEQVRWTLMRGNETLLSVMINWRASYRWIAIRGGELVVRDEPLWMKVEPAHYYTRIQLASYSGEPVKQHDGTMQQPVFNESFEWTGKRLTMNTIAAVHPKDYYRRMANSLS